MSSHPPGLRFSPFLSAGTQSANNTNNNNNVNNKLKMQQQSQQQQIQQQQQQSQQGQIVTKNKTNFNNHSINSFSDSETDLSNSIENLSMEERFVLRHTARVEPQGQENLQENLIPGRYSNDNRLSSNASTDSTRYASSNRSMSETRNPIYSQPQILQSQQNNNINNPTNNNNNNNNSNRNSLKEVNSNRSSMDVSTCSYNTLIIHNDDSMYSSTNDYTSPPPNHPFLLKKDRPRSYGEKGMQEITEIPDDYLDQSHVLKHLAKEVKIPTNKSDSTARDSGLSENTDSKDQNYANNNENQWIEVGENEQNQSNKIKSKSQPDLTRLGEIDLDTVETLMKDNAFLKQQLQNCLLKVAKTQKLEEEVAKIYRAHEELEQSCQRREKLELTIRTKLQNEIHRAQELNRVLRDQVDVLQSQLLAPSEHQLLIAQLFTQNKELTAAKERQEIELAAQRATLQEQRNHIGILDSALTNTQNNMRRLEEESRKKQIYIEHLLKLQQNSLQSKQNERKMRLEYDNELSKDSNRSGSSTNSESKWQLHDKDGQILRLENECAKLEQQRHLEESAIRQSAAKIVMEKNSQEADRIIAEAKQEKLRYLEEVHSAQRKVSELQNHLKGLESRLAEKDALIRVLQGQKNYGSSNSYDSYNLSNESFVLNPLVYNSQASFNVSNSSFNTTANTSLLEPSYGQTASSFNHPVASYGGGYSTHGTTNYGQTTPTSFNQSALNLQAIAANYGQQSSSNYNTNYVSNVSNYSPNNGSNYDTNYEQHQYDAARKSIDDHMKKQFDEQLSKRGLCCFPGLTGKKPIQSLLADEVSVLSTNNSDAFLQKLAHIDQRERERHHEQIIEEEMTQSNSSNANKNEEITLLEKQGRCSQKMRNNSNSSSNSTMGNLIQVSQTVGQNMTDISNIGILPPRTKEIPSHRGSSLPPTALPRPPRSLKPPRKIEYDRLTDNTDLKKQRSSQTPPKSSNHHRNHYELKTSSLKRGEFGKASREYSPAANFTIKHKNYGSMNHANEYPSTKNYQRLDDNSKLKMMHAAKESSPSMKRSLLPGARTSNLNANIGKISRDSINSGGSSGSNNSQNSRSSPMHINSEAGNIIYHHHQMNGQQYQHSRTPPKYIRLTPPPIHHEGGVVGGGNPNLHNNNNQNQRSPGGGGNINFISSHKKGFSGTKMSSLPVSSNTMYHQPNPNSLIPHPSPTSSSSPSPSQLTMGGNGGGNCGNNQRNNNIGAALPPKPADAKNSKRANSVARSIENRYRIQF